MNTEIAAKIIEDSISQTGVRLVTLQLSYPRFIHSEFMTHRVFSRNASSSRAIPLAKTIAMVRESPAEPIHWGVNQPGMQAQIELAGKERSLARELWLKAAEAAATYAEQLSTLGVHKQVANRVLEPYVRISVIVTATEWSNFFVLREHSDAQPEIQFLATSMQKAIRSSVPREVSLRRDSVAGWHLPYVTKAERTEFPDPIFLAKLSAARCARVSYLTHEGQTPSHEKDLVLYDRLVGSVPLHASPIEHQATPLSHADSWSRNFRGWYQYRELVEGGGAT